MMKLPRRQFLQLAAGAAALPTLARIAQAQTYPSRPVRIITGFAAGGATDITARLIGQWLSERLGQPFIIENRQHQYRHRGNPGKLNVASAGIGTLSHMAGELFKMMAMVNMVHVPYRSTGPALADLIGGQVQVAFPGVLESIGY